MSLSFISWVASLPCRERCWRRRLLRYVACSAIISTQDAVSSRFCLSWGTERLTKLGFCGTCMFFTIFPSFVPSGFPPLLMIISALFVSRTPGTNKRDEDGLQVEYMASYTRTTEKFHDRVQKMFQARDPELFCARLPCHPDLARIHHSLHRVRSGFVFDTLCRQSDSSPGNDHGSVRDGGDALRAEGPLQRSQLRSLVRLGRECVHEAFTGGITDDARLPSFHREILV